MTDLIGVHVAVVGPGSEATLEDVATATQVAETLAGDGAVIVTGGMDGVLRAGADGAPRAGRTSVGLLPRTDRRAPPPGTPPTPALTAALPPGLTAYPGAERLPPRRTPTPGGGGRRGGRRSA